MLDMIFQHPRGVVDIRINGKSISFGELKGQYVTFVPLNKSMFSIAGILKEFPDLKDKTNEEIKDIAMARFKEKINSFTTEKEIADYIRDDLAKHGYKLTMILRPGFRPEIIK